MFRVGQKVKLKTREQLLATGWTEEGQCLEPPQGGSAIMPGMLRHLGTTAKIDVVCDHEDDDDGRPSFEIEGCVFNWVYDAFVPPTPKKLTARSKANLVYPGLSRPLYEGLATYVRGLGYQCISEYSNGKYTAHIMTNKKVSSLKGLKIKVKDFIAGYLAAELQNKLALRDLVGDMKTVFELEDEQSA